MLRAKSLSPSPTDEAFAAVWSADYHRALALLHNVDLPGCASMRARVWLRLGLYDRVIDEYHRRDLADYDAHDAVQLCGFAATAFCFKREFERSDDSLSKARLLAGIANDPKLNAFCFYTEARNAVIAKNLQHVDSLLDQADTMLATAKNTGAEPMYFIELAIARAHVAEVRSAKAALSLDDVAHEKSLLEAAKLLTRTSCTDRLFQAAILTNLANLISQRPFESGRRYLVSCIEGLSWTSLTDQSAARIRRALSCNSMLFGTDNASLGSRAAPSLVLRHGLCVDALLFDNWLEPSRYFAEARFAISLALDIEWDPRIGPEIFDLLGLSAAVVPFDADLAARLNNVFWRVAPELAINHFALHQPRARASERFADGCLAKASGNFGFAAEAFEEALAHLQIDQSLGRLALYGIESYTISRDDSDLKPARLFVSSYKSRFAYRIAQALENIESCEPGDFPYLGMYGISTGHRDLGRSLRITSSA